MFGLAAYLVGRNGSWLDFADKYDAASCFALIFELPLPRAFSSYA